MKVPCLVLAVLLAGFCSAQPGANDPTFNPGDSGRYNGDGAGNIVRAIVSLPDGSSYLGGDFARYNGLPRNRVVRLTPTGEIDLSFVPSSIDMDVYTMAVQSDGKLLIGGNYSGISRLNQDGTFDTGFNPAISWLGGNNPIMKILVQPDGKIILVGNEMSGWGGGPYGHVVRLNADGSYDTSIGSWFLNGANDQVSTALLRSDGSLIIAGKFTTMDGQPRGRIALLNANLELDPSITFGTGANGEIRTIEQRPDGRLLIAGAFTAYNGVPFGRIALLEPDGTIANAGFNTGTGASARVHALHQRPDGRLVLTGIFTSFNGSAATRIVGLTANGAIDPTFDAGEGADNDILCIAGLPDGKLLLGGEFYSFDHAVRRRVARLQPEGANDMTFNPGTGADADIHCSALQPDGRILIGGAFTLMNETPRYRIARLLSDGELDPSFDPGEGADGPIHAMVLQSDGKVIIGGGFTHYDGAVCSRIARLNADGSLDAGYTNVGGPNGTVMTMATSPGGKLVIGGAFTSVGVVPRIRLARLDSNGDPDLLFVPPVTPIGTQVTACAVANNGKVTFAKQTGALTHQIVRLHPTGGVDLGYSTGSGANGVVHAILLGPGDQSTVVGAFTTIDGLTRNRIARLLANGDVSQTIAIGDGANETIRTIVRNPDGKLIIGGDFSTYEGALHSRVARLFPDLQHDPSFASLNGVGTIDVTEFPSVHTLSWTPSGTFIGGAFGIYGGAGRNRAARALEDGSISTGPVASPICPGTNFQVTFTTTSSFAEGNIFLVQLSDELGDFDDPSVIGSSSGTTGMSIGCNLPLATIPGDGYRIRVVSNLPAVEGSDNGTDLVVLPTFEWWMDNDEDGLGDPADTLHACTQPTGSVDNADDACPLLAGTIGSPCDDLDPGTEGDLITDDCICAGTPVIVCTGHEARLLLHTDANPAQLNWTILDAAGNEVAAGGPSADQNNTTVTFDLCLPDTVADCFRLRLQDAFGDGILGGGWELQDMQGHVLLRDDLSSGSLSPASPTQNPLYGQGHPFCLPAGPTRLEAAYCGMLTYVRTDTIRAVAVGAADYQFEISDPDAGFTRRIVVPRPWLCFAEMVTNPVVPDITYWVRVRADQGAPGITDDHYGPGCEVRLVNDAHCTGLIDTPSTNTHSCGVTRTFGGSDKVWARPASGATAYRFRFVHSASGFVRNIQRPSYVCALDWVTSPLQNGLTYNVRVETLVGGTWRGFCGPVCTVTIAAPGGLPASSLSPGEDTADMTLFPNPSNSGSVELVVHGIDGHLQELTVDIRDARGTLVITRMLFPQQGTVRAPLPVEELASGVYFVQLRHGGVPLVRRLVIQR